MIEFRALGAVEVRGVESSDAEALASHPYWLAVLACLVTPPSPAGWLRAELAALLWSSVDESRGRASLRVVLHGLRRHLGRDSIVSSGDALRVDPEVLTSDVTAFRDLLSERRHEEALKVYAGDLLPGFGVRGAPRFDTWLFERRDALRRSAADAARAVTAAAERRGQWIYAARHARRAATLSMNSEAAVRRLLRLLDRAGDRTSALREYEDFAARWRRDLGVEPSAETLSLVEEIRTRGTADSGPDRPAASDGWPVSTRLVVLPFEIDSGDPGLEHLAAGLAHDVIASLARVCGTVVAARSPARRHAGKAAPEADAVLDTSVRIVADQFVFVSRLVDVRLGRPTWAEAYVGSRDDLLGIRRRLLHDVLAAMGAELSEADRDHLERGQTNSPEAFELYLEARSRWNRRTTGEIEAAIELLEAALAIDPSFALAQAGLMDAYTTLHPAAGRRMSESGARGRAAGRRALELEPRLGEVHATLGLLRGFVDQDWDGSEADLRRAIELSPGHASAHHWLGAVLTFIRREFEEGARELEIARQLDPGSPAIRADDGLAHMNRGDLEGARRLLRELAADEPDFWRAPYFLGVTCFVAGDPDAGAEHLGRAWGLGAFGAQPEGAPPDEGGDVGDWRTKLERRLERLAASRLQPGIRAVEAALLCMFLGRRADAIRWLRTVSEHSSAAWIGEYFPVFEPLLDEPGFREFLADTGLTVS